MASFMTNKGKFELINRAAVTSQIWRLLLVNTPPANAGTAADLNFVSQVTSLELSGTGYARVTLASPAVTEDDTNDYAKITATNPGTYTAINAGTIAGAWVFLRTSGGGSDIDATDPLVCFLDCTDLVTNGGDVTLSFDATNGILTLA